MDMLAETLLNRLKSTDIAAVRRLQTAFAQAPPFISVGTACSGTDLAFGVLRSLARSLRVLGVNLNFDHIFACDTKEASRGFISTNWTPKALM